MNMENLPLNNGEKVKEQPEKLDAPESFTKFVSTVLKGLNRNEYPIDPVHATEIITDLVSAAKKINISNTTYRQKMFGKRQ